MGGPAPKPLSHRRRTNAVAGARQLDGAGRIGAAPKPKTKTKLCATAVAYWRTIWASPMALVYTDADVFPLTRLVLLVHERDQGRGSASADGELRQLEDRFGLSPMSRRRLNWEINAAAAARVAELHAVPGGARPSAVDRLRGLDPRVLEAPGWNHESTRGTK
jgi:hypothetical protein